MSERRIDRGRLGPEVRISGAVAGRDGMVARLLTLDDGDPPLVVARYTEGGHALIIERDELAAMLDLIDGKPVTDVAGWTHKGGSSWLRTP